MKVRGGDGSSLWLPPVLRPRVRNEPWWLPAYMRAMSVAFVGIALYAAWLHAGWALVAGLLSAAVCQVWSRARRNG